MAKYLVETYYTCSFKVSHYLDDINEENLNNQRKMKTENLKLSTSNQIIEKQKIFKIQKVVKQKSFHNQLAIKILKVVINPNQSMRILKKT